MRTLIVRHIHIYAHNIHAQVQARENARHEADRAEVERAESARAERKRAAKDLEWERLEQAQVFDLSVHVCVCVCACVYV